MKTKKSRPCTERKTSDHATPPGARDCGDKATDIEQARLLLGEVSVLACTALRLSRERSGLPGLDGFEDDDNDDLDDRLQLVRQALARVGWVADVAMRKLGGPGSFERAEDWMLPGS